MKHPYPRPWGIHIPVRRKVKKQKPPATGDDTVYDDSGDEFELGEGVNEEKIDASPEGRQSPQSFVVDG